MKICLRVTTLLSVSAALALIACGCERNGRGDIASGHDFGGNDSNMYVAMGDSITRGYAASIPYPSVLSSMLGKTVINKGVNGARSSAGRSSVNSVLSSYKPGYLLIFYGANDIINGVSPSEVSSNLRAMIQAAKANNTVPVIATCTPQIFGHSAFNGGIISLNSWIRSLASEEGVKLVDLESAFSGHDEYYTSDGLHPNNVGHQVIAAEFADVL